MAPQARRGTRSPRKAWAPIAARKGVMPPMKVAFATVTRPSARMKKTEDALEQAPARTAGQPASRIASVSRPRWTIAMTLPTMAVAPSER
jgi:hypothetical protein